MAAGLAVILKLGLLAGASALRTTYNSVAAVDNAVTEVGRRCAIEDYGGALDVVESYNGPLGAEHGKELLKACFMGPEGECLTGEIQCAWMQKCLATEGACGAPPIKETLKEIPGGEVVLNSLAETASEASSKIGFQVSELMQAFKTLQDQFAPRYNKKGKKIPFSDPDAPPWKYPVPDMTKNPLETFRFPNIRQKKAQFHQAVSDVAGALTSKKAADVPRQRRHLLKKFFMDLQYDLYAAKGARGMWLHYIPRQPHRIWIYTFGTLGLWFALACGTQYSIVKMVGKGKLIRPVYSWFAPMGVFKNPFYSQVIMNPKMLEWHNWRCQHGNTTLCSDCD